MHVNDTLRLFELPDDGIQQFPTHINLTRIFARGVLVALSLAALREHGAPMTSRAISAEIVRRKGWDVNGPVLQRGTTAKLQHVRLLIEHGYEKGFGCEGYRKALACEGIVLLHG